MVRLVLPAFLPLDQQPLRKSGLVIGQVVSKRPVRFIRTGTSPWRSAPARPPGAFAMLTRRFWTLCSHISCGDPGGQLQRRLQAPGLVQSRQSVAHSISISIRSCCTTACTSLSIFSR